MGLKNGLSVKEKNANKRNPGIQASVPSIFNIWSDLTASGPTYGYKDGVPAEDPPSVQETRNAQLDTYWNLRIATANRMLGYSVSHPSYRNAVDVLCDGLEIFRQNLNGSSVVPETTEEELLRCLLLGTDTMLGIIVQGDIVVPEVILTPLAGDPFYDQFWSGDAIDPADPETWGDFTPPKEYTDYYNITGGQYRQRYNHIQQIGNNARD